MIGIVVGLFCVVCDMIAAMCLCHYPCLTSIQAQQFAVFFSSLVLWIRTPDRNVFHSKVILLLVNNKCWRKIWNAWMSCFTIHRPSVCCTPSYRSHHEENNERISIYIAIRKSHAKYIVLRWTARNHCICLSPKTTCIACVSWWCWITRCTQNSGAFFCWR